MSKTDYRESLFRITHTIEEEGPLATLPHDFYEDTFVITILVRCSGICYIEGNNYTISDGDIIVMSPDDIHSFRFTQNGYHERISIYLSGNILSGFDQYQLSLIQLFRKFSHKKKYIYSPKDYDEYLFVSIRNQLCKLISDKEISMQNARIHLTILQLLFLLYDSNSKALDLNASNSQSSFIGEICTYIREHLTENLSYEDLQKRFFASRYQLTTHFQNNVGMSLTKYIISKRLMHVISLVRNGESIENAVYNSGFNSYSHFYKEFKKKFNISPKAYFKL